MMNEIIAILREFGFPVFMCLWFMFRTEKVIKANTAALMSIRGLIK